MVCTPQSYFKKIWKQILQERKKKLHKFKARIFFILILMASIYIPINLQKPTDMCTNNTRIGVQGTQPTKSLKIMY